MKHLGVSSEFNFPKQKKNKKRRHAHIAPAYKDDVGVARGYRRRGFWYVMHAWFCWLSVDPTGLLKCVYRFTWENIENERRKK